MQYDLKVTNGQVFLPGDGLCHVDLLIKDGRISAIVESGSEIDANEIFDATGKWVLPGAIDPHVHLGKDITVPKDEDDVAKETASAAAGGVTSILAYLMSPKPYEELIGPARNVMEEHSYVDFGFHFCLVAPEQVKNIPFYTRDLGVSSFKFFMNFRGDEGAYLGLPGNDDGFMYELLGAAADAGAMVNPHAENIEIVWKLRQQKPDQKAGPLELWNNVRPPFVEAEAEQRVAYLASVTGASLYAVHTSSGEALDALLRQRQHYDNIFIESCPHYLTLSTDSPIGTYGKVNPPLRPVDDLEAIWEGLRSGAVDTIGSDHVPRHRSAKEKDIWKASAGFPGMGTMLPTMITHGLRRGLSLERIVDLTSTRAAKLFGLYPRKGRIAVGADADLAVIAPDQPLTVQAANLHSGAEYSPWEGQDLDVTVTDTIVRGRFALRNGQLAQQNGTFLERAHSGAAALNELTGVTK